jgi:hypothetical protein
MRHEDLAPYLDPSSKQYVFSQARIDAYRPTKKELADQLVAPIVAGAVPGSSRPPLVINLSFPPKQQGQ